MITFFIHIPLIAFICWHLYRKNRHKPLIAFYWWGLLGKLLAGISIGLLYLYYYPYQGDTFTYFNDAAKLSTFAHEHPLSYLKILLFNQSTSAEFTSSLELWQQPRALFMAKLVSVFCLFTGNNYWLCGLYLSLLSFAGLWTLSNTLARLFPSSEKAAGIAFLLFPSVLIWSSGLTKESLVMACIAGFLHLCLSWRYRLDAYSTWFGKVSAFLLASVCLILLWKLKYYYLAILLPACIAFLLADVLLAKLYKPGKLVRFAVLGGVFGAILVSATFLHPNLRIDNFLQALFINHNITLAASAAEDVISFTNLQPAIASVIRYLPEAIFAGLFRPLLWEANTFFQYYVGLENLLLLMCTLYVLIKLKSLSVQSQRDFLLMAVSLLYIILLAGLLALSSPNFGALSRYKVAFLPFMTYLLIWAASLPLQPVSDK